MLKITNITKEFDEDMGEIIKDCLVEYGLDIPGTAWEDPYLHKFSEYYKDINGEYFVALLEERDDEDDFLEINLAGGCGYGPLVGVPDTCELQKLYIDKNFRNMGIAQDLLNIVEKKSKKHYKKIYLETDDKMVEAIKFYKKNGYKKICSALGNTGHNACGTYFIKEL